MLQRWLPSVGGLNLTDCTGSFVSLLGLEACENDYGHEANRIHHRERNRNSNLAAAASRDHGVMATWSHIWWLTRRCSSQ
jgi:hypothetical protein